eukprot:11200941-Lingulodinium_polyedra.AAC.1
MEERTKLARVDLDRKTCRNSPWAEHHARAGPSMPASTALGCPSSASARIAAAAAAAAGPGVAPAP